MNGLRMIRLTKRETFNVHMSRIGASNKSRQTSLLLQHYFL